MLLSVFVTASCENVLSGNQLLTSDVTRFALDMNFQLLFSLSGFLSYFYRHMYVPRQYKKWMKEGTFISYLERREETIFLSIASQFCIFWQEIFPVWVGAIVNFTRIEWEFRKKKSMIPITSGPILAECWAWLLDWVCTRR